MDNKKKEVKTCDICGREIDLISYKGKILSSPVFFLINGDLDYNCGVASMNVSQLLHKDLCSDCLHNFWGTSVVANKPIKHAFQNNTYHKKDIEQIIKELKLKSKKTK